jgi:hypothetical protein
LFTKGAGEQSSGKRGPRDAPNAKHLHNEEQERKKIEESNLECGEHFSLFFTVDQAVVILHRNKRREAVRDGIVWINPCS